MRTQVPFLGSLCLVAACAADRSSEITGRTDQSLSIQYVQSAVFSDQTDKQQTSATVAFSSSQTQGNLNVVTVGWIGPTPPSVATVTDSAGNTYVPAVGASTAYAAGPAAMALFYAPNVEASASNTVTVTFATGVLFPEVIVAEYSGADPVAPYDNGVGQGGNTSLSDSGPLTTGLPNELLVSANYLAHSTLGAGAGFTRRLLTDDADILEDTVAASVGTYDGTASLNRGWWVAVMGAFKPLSGRPYAPGPATTPVVGLGDDSSAEASGSPQEGGDDGGAGGDGGPDGDSSGEVLPSPPDANADGGYADGTVDDDPDATGEAGGPLDASVVDTGVEPPADSASASGVAFPLKTIPGRRYLADQNDVPYLIKGDSAWEIVTTLPYSDVAGYIADRQAKGFNSVLVELIDNQWTAGSNGANANGDLPFTTAQDGTPYTNALTQLPDFSTPNPPYWQNADLVLNYLASRGMLVFLYPTWLGYGGGGPNLEGYYPAMEASSLETLQGYGRFVAQRYGSLPNIVWMLGGDYNPPDKTTTEAIANGILQADTTHLMSVDCSDGTSPLDYWAGEPWLTLNDVYTDSQLGHPFVHEKSFAEYQLPSSLPFFFKEGCYENDHSSTATLIRQQAYAALLSGGSGQFYGNAPMWTMQPGYQAYLNSRAALDMEQWNTLFTSRRWDLLVPDIAGIFVLNNASYGGTLPSQAVAFASAARASDGSWGVAYVPATEPIDVDLSAFAHAVDAYWFDPTSGNMEIVAGSPLANSGSIELTPPGANSTGDLDWVLLME